eukprot:111630_1
MNFRQFNNNHYQTMKRKQSKSSSKSRRLTSSEKPASARKLYTELEALVGELEDEQLQDELGCVTIDHIVNGIIKNDQLKKQIISGHGLGLKVLVNYEKNKEIRPCVNLDDINPLELLYQQKQRTPFVPTYTNTSAIQKLY